VDRNGLNFEQRVIGAGPTLLLVECKEDQFWLKLDLGHHVECDGLESFGRASPLMFQ
ncbi:MAG: hypothetical protein RLY14_844, partial [Planctomycetota bacterium]